MNRALASFKKNVKWLGITTTTATILVLTSQAAWSGSAGVVTTGDSSSTGTINFESCGSSSCTGTTNLNTLGQTTQIRINSKVQVIASSQATAINNGTITQAQADSGIGAGGVVVTLDQATTDRVVIASTALITGDGNRVSPLQVLTQSTDLSDVALTTPTGVTVTIGTVLSHLVNALNASPQSPTLVGTTLNDATIFLRQALLDDKGDQKLRQAGQAVAALLKAAATVPPGQ